MPEGPSIVILKEEALKFEGKKVRSVSGNSKIDQSRMDGKKITSLKSWGKHFLICFPSFTLRIHFLLFGSYRIDEQKPGASPRLSFVFENGELNFYSCSVKFLEGDVDSHYDWSVDVMNDGWNPQNAKAKLKEHPLCSSAMHCWNRTSFPVSATLSRTKYCTASKSTPNPW